MSSLLGAGVLVMIVADAVVGGRLVGLSLRTRRLPELALGGSILLLGAVGYPLSIAARKGLAGGPEEAAWLLGTALAVQNAGAAAMGVATWSTFRSASRVAGATAAAVAALLAGTWLAMWATNDFAKPTGSTAYYWMGFAPRAFPYAWSAWESWAYYVRLRRRLALGLADPLVTDRFRLWAICASSVCAAFAIFGTALAVGADVSTSPWVLGPTSAVGGVSGVTLWLAFFPPRRYAARFECTGSGPSTAEAGPDPGGSRRG